MSSMRTQPLGEWPNTSSNLCYKTGEYQCIKQLISQWKGRVEKGLSPATGEWWEAFLEAHQEVAAGVAAGATLLHSSVV